MRFRILLGFASLGLVAASASLLSPGVGDQVRASLSPDEYVAHEWGTFTSLEGADGVDQPGMHHGDEPLPRFVHCPLGFSYGDCFALFDPGIDSPLSTTQRMETPVIYFYSNTEKAVDVKVDFPKGLVSEWYPEALAYSPQAGQVSDLANGQINWQVTLKNGPLDLPEVDGANIWQAQREVDSNYLTSGTENEKFIFYRGIGRFTVPFKVTSNAADSVTLANSSEQAIPSLILLDFNGQSGAFKAIDGLNAGASLTLAAAEIPHAEQGDPQEIYLTKISALLQDRLIAAGLFPLEAAALTNTWSRSYFLTPGLRALYILPRTWTDELVPLQFSPAPKSLERVFVGRVEIFLQSQENDLLTQIAKAIVDQVPYYEFPLESLGRFTAPKLARIYRLSSDEETKNYVLSLIGVAR